jgi:hypothetical protein
MDKVGDETKNELNFANRKHLIFTNIIQFSSTDPVMKDYSFKFPLNSIEM